MSTPTSPEFTQTPLALSNAIIGVVNSSEEWKQWKKTKRLEEDWKDFLRLPHDTYWIYRAMETERKNKIKEARAQDIEPPLKRKNTVPPTSRVKKTTVQPSETNSDIAEVDDEFDASLIAYNENDFSNHNSITYNNTDIPKSPTITPRIMSSSIPSRIPVQSSATSFNSIKAKNFELDSDDNASESSTTMSRTMRVSRFSKVPAQLSATSFKAIEVDSSEARNCNDASELSAVTSRTIKLSTHSRIPTWLSATTTSPSRSTNPARLSANSKAVGVDHFTINNDNDISESPITTSHAMRTRSSKISTRSSASSNRVETDDAQS
ncbi:18223_t:CDS:2, partial [Racocetra fulgida]